MGRRPTKGDEDARKAKSPVAYARGSERGRYRAATVRESVPLSFNHATNVFNGALPRTPHFCSRSLAVAVRPYMPG